jgi:general secretion pathway protein F
MVRAGEASGALAVIFERLAEFERSRDDLRNYIISSMIYPALLAWWGWLHPDSADLRGAALRQHLRRFPHEDPRAHQDHARGQRIRQAYWWIGAAWPWWPPSSGGPTRAPSPAACGGTGRGSRFPLLGDALLKAETARFARAMATLVANTVPLVQSIAIAAATLNNKTIPARWGVARASSAARASPSPCARRGSSRRWPRTC